MVPSALTGWISDAIAGALTGGGAAAASRLWPGLPLGQMIQYGPAVAIYGAVIGLLAGSDHAGPDRGLYHQTAARSAACCWTLRGITLRFGGAEAIKKSSADIRRGRNPRHHRAERGGKVVDAERDFRFLCTGKMASGSRANSGAA